MSISAMTVEDCKKIIRKRLGDYRYQQAQIFYGTQHRYSPSLWPPVR